MIDKNNSYDFRKIIPSPEISIFSETVKQFLLQLDNQPNKNKNNKNYMKILGQNFLN